MQTIRKKRIDALYEKDGKLDLRNSHDNVNIQKEYKEFYEKPLSPLAYQLLHTIYHK